MAALTLIYYDWNTGTDGYGRLPQTQCSQYSTGAYLLASSSGGNKVFAHCFYGTNGHADLTATVTCPAETIPDFNSGYCVPYLSSTLYIDALKAVISTTVPPAPSGGGGAAETGGSGFALPEMTPGEGLTIALSIALAWGVAWGFRQMRIALFTDRVMHD
jgi:hypothetical protein